MTDYRGWEIRCRFEDSPRAVTAAWRLTWEETEKALKELRETYPAYTFWPIPKGKAVEAIHRDDDQATTEASCQGDCKAD